MYNVRRIMYLGELFSNCSRIVLLNSLLGTLHSQFGGVKFKLWSRSVLTVGAVSVTSLAVVCLVSWAQGHGALASLASP